MGRAAHAHNCSMGIFMLKQSLSDSWSFFKNHIVAISIIILPIVVPVDIFAAIYQYFLAGDEFVLTEQLLPMVVGLIAYPIYSVGVVFYIASIISGEHLDTKSLWKLGAQFWLPYIILTILVTMAVILGFILLVIPGLILASRYAFSEFDLLFNQSRPLDAMRSSWNSTKEYMWVILGGYAVITLCLYAPYYAVASLFDESSVSYLALNTLSNIAYSVLWALYTIFAFRVYAFSKLQSSQSLNQDAP